MEEKPVDGGSGIRTYPENSYYWMYDGDPTLLLGGSPTDNLSQHVGNPDIDVEGALDALAEAGGNYVRHTMQSRVNDEEASFIVQPFGRSDDGRFDLESWNDEYWDRFERVLEWTAERDIVMQVTLWDRFDFADHYNDNWRRYNAWNPANNDTYTTGETGLPIEWPGHPARFVHRFMLAPEDDNDTLLDYQERYVARVLESTFEYDHVLYNVSNETRAPKSWGDYWAEFVHERASRAAAEPVYVTQMYDEWDITDPMHDRTHEDPATYDYVDVSQNNQIAGQRHFDNLVTVRDEFRERPWPLNNVKCYGADSGSFGTTRDGLERFWRSIFGGSASIRFHRPDHGLGIGDTARTHIRAAREVTDELEMATADPRPYALVDRTENEAYCIGDGDTYLVLFTDGGSVGLDIDVPDSATVAWYDVSAPGWVEEEGAGSVPGRLSPPGEGFWVAAIRP
ncbi:MAG: hypothetical protein ABEH66_06315 [Halobacteriales archaeon]